jgi:uncharacterized oxidoreductase
MTSSDYKLFKAEGMREAIAMVIAATGSSGREPQQVADNLVLANLKGHDSHGIGMVPRYVDSFLEGGLKVNQQPLSKIDAGPLLGLDGQAGFGQSIGEAATDMAIARAKEHGVCVMGLGHAHHLGRIGHWAEQAVSQDLISIHFVNVLSRPTVAPWGGAAGRFGTNPCCIGIPMRNEAPVILDYATSMVAQGKMRVAHNKGEEVRSGMLIDQHGHPTTNPSVVVVEPLGALLTFGEHKGFGMAMVCELLGGALSGGGTWHKTYQGEKKVYNGMLSILIDPKRLDQDDHFFKESEAFMSWLRSVPVAPGFDKVRIAGEPEREAMATRSKDGFPVDPTTWQEILAAAEKLKLPRAGVEQAAQRA